MEPTPSQQLPYSQSPLRKRPKLCIIGMGIITVAAAFLLGIAWENKSALRNAGEKIIELCGFDPSKLKQTIDQKIIEHNKSFYADDVLLTSGNGISNLSITPEQKISLPIIITGTADSGNWFFEGSFPVSILDKDGKVISQGFAGAEGEWMTADTVSFTTKLNGGNYTGSATIVFKQDDPSDGESGKPIKEFRIPVFIE
jgi:hypothetical protein